MKSVIRTALLKLPLIAIGIFVLCLVVSFVLTDPAPSTLPRRTRRLFAAISAILSSAPKVVPSPPLVNMPVVPAEAAGLVVRDEYYVVGVELNGESRAYPLNMLSRPEHHVLNDTLGGQPIAVTWCGVCQSPVVYASQVEGKTLTFYVSGELHGENMLMQDVETGSDWPQMLGEAIKGPLKGKSLEQIPSVWTDWKTWRTEHPQTTVLKIAQTIDYYRRDRVSSSSSFEERYFATLQWGLVRSGKALSWPLRELAGVSVVNDTFAGLPFVIVFERRRSTITAFDRRVGDTELTFRSAADGLIDDQTSSLWDLVSGRAIRGPLAGRHLTPVAGIVSQPRAWRTLHPETEIRTAHPG